MVICDQFFCFQSSLLSPDLCKNFWEKKKINHPKLIYSPFFFRIGKTICNFYAGRQTVNYDILPVSFSSDIFKKLKHKLLFIISCSLSFEHKGFIINSPEITYETLTKAVCQLYTIFLFPLCVLLDFWAFRTAVLKVSSNQTCHSHLLCNKLKLFL